MGRAPSEISVDFGKSFWNIIPFTMQMAFVVIGGYVVAVSAPVRKVIDALARFPRTPKVAVAMSHCWPWLPRCSAGASA
jgi:short-chain fatty acids transporter